MLAVFLAQASFPMSGGRRSVDSWACGGQGGDDGGGGRRGPLTMLKSRRSLSSLSVPTGAILCGWFILQRQRGARGRGWAPQA